MVPRLCKRLFSPALLLIVLPPLFWAGNFIIGRAVHGTVRLITLSLWRWRLAMLFILPFAWKSVHRYLPLYVANRWLLIRLSLPVVVAFNSLVCVGLHETTAADALLLNSLITVLIALFGALFFRERLDGLQAGELLTSCAGVMIIISHGDGHALVAISFSHGDLIVFCAIVFFTFYTLWLRSIPSQIDRLGLMAAQIAVAFIFLSPFWLTEYAREIVTVWDMPSLMTLLYLGVFPSVLAYLLFNHGVARFGAAQAGLSIHAPFWLYCSSMNPCMLTIRQAWLPFSRGPGFPCRNVAAR